jgi:hypothetical protein
MRLLKAEFYEQQGLPKSKYVYKTSLHVTYNSLSNYDKLRGYRMTKAKPTRSVTA